MTAFRTLSLSSSVMNSSHRASLACAMSELINIILKRTISKRTPAKQEKTHLYNAIVVSGLPKRFTTVSNNDVSLLICSNTTSNPNR